MRAACPPGGRPGRLEAAARRLNPGLAEEALRDAVRQVANADGPDLIEENQRVHRPLTNGVDVETKDSDGRARGAKAWLIDWNDPSANDWLVTRQFTVVEGRRSRRPDVVAFVNGLPLAVLELKNPTAEAATLTGAFNQLQTYKREVPSLFRANAVLVTSDGLSARIGSLTADEDRFMPWPPSRAARTRSRQGPARWRR